MRNVKIKLTRGERIIYESRVKKIVRPGEMERIEIKDKLLELLINNLMPGKANNEPADINVEVLQI